MIYVHVTIIDVGHPSFLLGPMTSVTRPLLQDHKYIWFCNWIGLNDLGGARPFLATNKTFQRVRREAEARH